MAGCWGRVEVEVVELEGFHLVAVARRESGLVLDIESCDRCAGCLGCRGNHIRLRARGGGGDWRTWGRGPGANPLVQTTLDVARTYLADGNVSGVQREGCALHGLVRDAGNLLGDP